MKPAGLSAAALLLTLAVPAAAQDARVPVVEVEGTAPDRDEKAYADIFKAIAVFEKKHAIAPKAVLRFKVLPRQVGGSLDGLTMQLVGPHTHAAIPLTADHTFSLPVDPQAAEDGAVVRSNRKEGSLAWRADVRSPGLAPNVRRLGDLLLECQVAARGDLIDYVHHPINLVVTKMDDPCRTVNINMFHFADRPVFSIALVDGKRRSVLPAAMLHGPTTLLVPSHEDWLALRERVYQLRFKTLYDQGWTDDTLLEFDYMDDEGMPLSSSPAQ